MMFFSCSTEAAVIYFVWELIEEGVKSCNFEELAKNFELVNFEICLKIFFDDWKFFCYIFNQISRF